MKKLKGILVLVFALLMCTTTIPAMAAESSKGNLINVEHQNYPDGTYSVEKTYVKPHALIGTMSPNTYGTDTFTKTKSWYSGQSSKTTLICTAELTATFDWDTSTKKVKVYDVERELTNYCAGDLIYEKTTTSGNNTKKAKVKYTFKHETDMGFENTRSMSLSCDYKGKDS